MAVEAVDGAKFLVGGAVFARHLAGAFDIDHVHRAPDNDLTRAHGFGRIGFGALSAFVVPTSPDVIPQALARGDDIGLAIFGIYVITILANAALLGKDLWWIYRHIDNPLARFHEERSTGAKRQVITEKIATARENNASNDGRWTKHGRLMTNQAQQCEQGKTTPVRSSGGRIPSAADGSERRIEGHRVRR